MSMDTVIGYYTVSEEVDHIIREGPRPGPDGEPQLEPFMVVSSQFENYYYPSMTGIEISLELVNKEMGSC